MTTPRRLGLAVVDLLAAAALVAGITTAAVAGAVVAVGADLVAVKRCLFVVGLLLSGVATLQLRSSVTLQTGEARPARTATDLDRPSRLRSLLEAALPASWHLPRRERCSDAAKLAVAGLLLLFGSYVMEAMFGVGG